MPIVLTEICNECRIPKSIGWSLQVHTNPLSRPILRIWWWLLLTPVRLFATPWTIAHQVPLPLGFPKQEYWSGLPFPPPGNLPHPGIEPEALMSPTLAGRFFTTGTTWEGRSRGNNNIQFHYILKHLKMYLIDLVLAELGLCCHPWAFSTV